MGRQWLHAKRLVASLKKSKTTGKLVKEISVAAKLGGGDPEMNARLFAAIEKAKKESVTKDAIDRAIKKGAGVGDEKMTLEHVVYEGYAPHKVAVIVEAMTDNSNRTGPEIKVIFRKGQLGNAGSNKFLFDAVGIVEAYTTAAVEDLEAVAIEAGANEVEELTNEENEDIPEDATGGKFLTDRTAIHEVSEWLKQNGWSVITSEPGFIPKNSPDLTDEQLTEVGEFLQELEDHDDVHRVWSAIS